MTENKELERLKEVTKGWAYPLNVSFHLSRTENGEQSICFCPVTNKSKLENLKFNSVRLFPLNGAKMAVITVEEINSVEQLKKIY